MEGSLVGVGYSLFWSFEFGSISREKNLFSVDHFQELEYTDCCCMPGPSSFADLVLRSVIFQTGQEENLRDFRFFHCKSVIEGISEVKVTSYLKFNDKM